MQDRSYRVLFWVLALVALLLDQGTKYGVFAWLGDVEGHTFAVFQTEPQSRAFAVVPAEQIDRERQRGFFLEVAFDGQDASGRRVPHVNQGACFGLGREHKTLANASFALISFVAATAILIWLRQKSTAQDRWLCIALGLILGGCLGNFYDRIVFNGVRDFLHWHYGFDWPVFNVADCCLVVGAGLLLLQAFFVPQAVEPSTGLAEEQALSGGTVACGAGTGSNV